MDGNKIKEGTCIGAINLIEIKTKNYVYASNVTSKVDGSHRNSAIETTVYKIYKDTMYINVSIEALEDLNFSGYCGFQLTAPPTDMQDRLYYMMETSFNDYLTTDYIGQEILSCTKSQGNLDRFNFYGTNDMIVVYRDKNVGLSDLRYIGDDTPVIYKSTGTKVYMHNMSMKDVVYVDLNQGDMFYWAGGYTFSSTGLKCDGCKKAYTVRERDKRVYIVDFDQATSKTYLEVYPEDIGKFINVMEQTEGVTCGEYITNKGLEVSSTGFGQLKFTVE